MRPELERYARQLVLAEIGPEGQEKLLEAKVAVVGCGALGTAISDSLARMGVGYIRIIDRDYVELNNLQRQVLFDEGDIAQDLSKAVAAARKLARVNSSITVEAEVADLNPDNIEGLLGGVELVIDGTDNFEARFLLNDYCFQHGIPWVYGGVIASQGMAMAFVPGRTPCFRCFLAELPTPGSTPTCDTAGVLPPVAHMVANLQVIEALKLLLGRDEELKGELLFFDGWSGRLEHLGVARREGRCPTCQLREYEFLEARAGSYLTSLCGRGAVQVNIRGRAEVSLAGLAERLAPLGEVRANEHMLRFSVNSYQFTVFPDGRAIIKGVTEPALARTLYAKYIGV